MRFVFFHVGNDISPSLLCKSILRQMPNAEIIQCSDNISKRIEGVTDIFRFDGDVNNLMTYRLQCFASLDIKKPTIYLDTDILVLNRIDPDELLGAEDVALCERVFDRNNFINTSLRGMDLSEYSGRTLGQVYPFVACFTITKSNSYWRDCYENLFFLDKKFHYWYGDQEAMRNVFKTQKYKTLLVPESKVACLPEHFSEKYAPLALHFKGEKRKKWMLDIASKLSLL